MLRFRLLFVHRPRRQINSLLVAIFLAGLLAGCASTRLDSATTPGFEPERDEREIWDRADAFDQEILEAGILSEDEALLTLIDTIARRVLPHLGAREDLPVRLHVVSNPYLNAWAQANGSIYLHSGVVARAENESQLAVVVAHELSHYIRRHTLEEHRIAKNKHNRAMAGSILAAVFAGIVVDPGSYAAHLADVQKSGHSRENEREADMDAFEAVRLAGYSVENAPRIFEQMQEEAKEIEQPFYHGSHPELARRIGYAKEYLKRHGLAPLAEGTPRGEPEETYDRNISALLLETADLSFASGYRLKARRSIDRHLAVNPDSLDGQLFRGRLALSRVADPIHREAAVRAYREVIRIDPNSALGHRSLGLMLMSSPSSSPSSSTARSEGLRSLDRYLALEPDAVDRPIIEAYKSSSFGAEGAEP